MKITFSPVEWGKQMALTIDQLNTIAVTAAAGRHRYGKADVVEHEQSDTVELYLDPVKAGDKYLRLHIDASGKWDAEECVPVDDDYPWEPMSYPTPELRDELPEEFQEKQRELAEYLYELYHGKGEWVHVLLAPTSDERWENYMRDAYDVLRNNPHLLTLDTLQAMGLES